MHEKFILVIGFKKIKYFHFFLQKKGMQIMQKSVG